jgi:hypothetical protein
MQPHFTAFCDDLNPSEDLAERVGFEQIQDWFGSPFYFLRPNKKKSRFIIHRVNDEFGAENRHYCLDVVFKPKYYTPLWNRIMVIAREGEKHPNFSQVYDNKIGNYAGILFPLRENRVIFSPAGLDDELFNYPIDEFDFKRTSMPLPNGIIGLGQDTYVIKHNAYGDTHIACTLNFAQNPATAGFLVLNPPSDALFLWRFSLFKGSPEEALYLAQSLNVFPTQKI